ncbi:petJ [Symbiodinium natans]|uniref:Cytochrome c-553 n=1 Tax=Symbiodinium natans TaxID=878477 RepID=A0A812QKX6_9DINO|nr:petJ [Symbiodinium natans]
MSRAVFVAGAALLLGASCFVLPGSTPRGAPEAQVSTGRAAGAAAPEAESATAAFSPLALGAALGLLAAVVGGRPALAADLENGEAIFNGNCTACHANGNNSIVAEKKLKPGKIRKALNVFNDDISCLLKKEALVQYGKYDVQAIMSQVTNGNGAMPAFGDKLGPDDIEDVANYVYSKADKW